MSISLFSSFSSFSILPSTFCVLPLCVRLCSTRVLQKDSEIKKIQRDDKKKKDLPIIEPIKYSSFRPHTLPLVYKTYTYPAPFIDFLDTL